jgi:hypothetical protein
MMALGLIVISFAQSIAVAMLGACIVGFGLGFAGRTQA